MKDVKIPQQMPFVSPILSTITFIFFMIAITSDHWIIDDSTPNGIFLADNGHDTLIEFTCNPLMTSRQCQILCATKAASVITVIWCSAATILLYYKWYSIKYGQGEQLNYRIRRYLDAEMAYPLNLILKSLMWLQMIFGLITIIMYGVFASSYYNGADDDVNFEDDSKSNDNDFSYAFYLWIAALVFATSTLGVVITAGNKPLYFCSAKDDESEAINRG